MTLAISTLSLRLRPGVSLEQTQAEMDAISGNLAVAHPETNNGLSVRVVPLRDQVLGGSRRVLLLLFACTGLVLLVACGNVANLLLARATTRQKEVAIRVALGAARLRILRQFLAESALIALPAGAFGANRLWQIDPGFDAQNLLTMTISLPNNKFEWRHNVVFSRQVIRSIEANAGST